MRPPDVETARRVGRAAEGTAIRVVPHDHTPLDAHPVSRCAHCGGPLRRPHHPLCAGCYRWARICDVVGDLAELVRGVSP